MRKFKLLMLALMAMCGLSVNAQSWTAAEAASGYFLMYNVGKGQFFTKGNGWGTQASMTDNMRDAIKVELMPVGDYYFIRTGVGRDDYGLEHLSGGTFYTDQSRNKQATWDFVVVGDASNHVYNIVSKDNHGGGAGAYATASAENTIVGPGSDGTTPYAQWKLLSEAEIELLEYKEKYHQWKLVVEALDDDPTVYTGDATIDISAAEAAFAAATTVDDVNAACDLLRQAAIAFVTSVTVNEGKAFDMTNFFLVNPDFEIPTNNGQLPPGWTITIGGQNCGQMNRTDTNPETGLQITNFIEAWHPSSLTPGVIAQTVTTLPEGTYRLECDASVCHDPASGDGTDITGAYLFIKSSLKTEREAVGNVRLCIKHYAVTFSHGGDGEVQFGLEATSDINANWLSADNFKVYYAGSVDLSVYADALAEAVADFEALESSLDATVYAALKTQVDALNKTYNQSRAYATAIARVQAINSYAAALIAANAVDQTAKMNATVLQTLQGAIAASVDASDVNALETATSNLTTATSNATTSIANYIEAKAILDAANIYDADGQASYAADETIAAIQTAYNNGTLEAVTAEQKAAAQAALVNACKAQTQPADGCDMSPWIVNANFDGNADGWTIEKRGNGWTGNPYNNGFIEYWTGSTTDANASGNFFDFYQVISGLPNGVYTIGASMHNDTNNEEGANWNGGGNAGVYGKTATNEVIELVYENSNNYANYTTDEILVVKDELRIGVKNINPLTGRWFAADNFKLTYVRQLTAEEEEDIAKANAVEAYNEALAAAQAIAEGSVPAPVYANLQSVITSNTLTDGTASEYNAAATALSEAAAAAQALVAPYAEWKALKPQADALVAVSTNNTEEKATLASVITEQNTIVEAATTTADAIITATSTLKGAMVIYATTAEPTNDECFDLTFMIVNPHFTEGNATNPTGWTVNYPARTDGQWGGASELRPSTHNFEAYHKQFTLSQTIPDLPKGTYKVTLQGFARHDDASVIDKTNLFCGIVNQTIKDINAEYSATSFYNNTMPALGDTNYDASGTLDGNTIYRPNGMTGAYYWFQEENPATNQPFYTSEVQTFIKTAGDLTIGFKCETWSDWVIWDNFHLYYYGSAIAVTIDEDQPISFSEEIENANVTLKRTFNAGKWNTIALPFDLTDAETKEAFGSDAEVATYSEELTDDGFGDSKVTFNIAADAAITANEPVLLKTSKSEISFTFNGKTIEAGEAKAEGAHNFDFVGVYAASTTIPVGDYFISSDKLWKSSGNTTIKGTRAYLKAKTDNARIAEFSIGEGETTGISIIATQKVDNAAYDMQGRRVETLKKGVYVVNGKKVVVK